MPPAFAPWAVVLAAGSGTRMAAAAGNTPKQFLSMQGMPLFWHSVLALASSPHIAGIVLVFPESFLQQASAAVKELSEAFPPGVPCLAVSGGARRQDSVRHGLAALPPQCAHVLIHDAARPFVSSATIQSVCEALINGEKAVIPAIPVTDTIKQTNAGYVAQTLPRETLVAVQTPQGFSLKELKAAHEECLLHERTVTDDASLLESCGIPVAVVEGNVGNVKITNPEDLALLKQEHSALYPCCGSGYDVHKYGDGRPMKLGGILIPNAPQIVAHSDGDVLLHALMDAMLGAACLGDIGQHFPDASAEFDNISSAVLLARVRDMLNASHVVLTQVDITVIAQTPKLSPYRESIRANVARLLGLERTRVNIKATTEEGLGFTGAKQGIKVFAQVCAFRQSSAEEPVSFIRG